MLKKIALTLAAATVLAGTSYALDNPDFIENVPTVNFKPSTNVKVTYESDLGTSTTPQNYLIAAKHTSGNTYYATSNISTTVYKLLVETSAGTALTLGAAAISSLEAGDSLFTGFTAM